MFSSVVAETLSLEEFNYCYKFLFVVYYGVKYSVVVAEKKYSTEKFIICHEFWVGSSVCDSVLNIKHGGTGTCTAFTLAQVLHRLSTIPSGLSSYFTHKVFRVLRLAFVLNASKSTSTLV